MTPTFVIVVLICGVVFVLIVRAAIISAMVVQRGINDDQHATETFCELLDEMKDSMLIHDDGEPGSFYDNARIVDLMRSKLDAGCRVRCLFNEPGPLLLTSELAEHRHFEVQYTPEWFPRDPDPHYKIVDNGRLVYLSLHLKDGTRRFEYLNYSWHRPKVRAAKVARQVNQFNDLMDLAKDEEASITSN